VIRAKDWLLCKFAGAVTLILCYRALVVLSPNIEAFFLFGMRVIHFIVVLDP
jgi:hypothetical protein